MSELIAEGLNVSYDSRAVLHNVTVEIPAGKFTVIVGPNACGKSTLLKTLSRVLKPSSGAVMLNRKDISSYRPKEVARYLGMLPQNPQAPEGIVVEDLISRGRFPHQGLLQQWRAEDTLAVEDAMERARVSDLRERPITELSGGQR